MSAVRCICVLTSYALSAASVSATRHAETGCVVGVLEVDGLGFDVGRR